MLEEQLHWIASTMRDELGHWMKRRYQQGICLKGAKARADMAESVFEESYLRHQWDLQKAEQLSVRVRE